MTGAPPEDGGGVNVAWGVQRRRPMTILVRRAALALILALLGLPAAAQTQLRIGIGDDPDALDPTLSRTYTARIVFASICDKLFDVDEKLNIIPQLALSHETSADGKALTIKL